MLLNLTCAFEVVTLSNERVLAFFHHFLLQFRHIVEIDQKAHNTTTSRPPIPCILQILTTFNLYSGRPKVGLSVNNKQKVRQAMVKISRGGRGGNHPLLPLARYVSRNGLTIGGLIFEPILRAGMFIQILLERLLFSQKGTLNYLNGYI